MPETKEETKDVKDESSKPDDTDGGKIDSKKKKHIIIAGGIMGVLVLGYLWYENKNSQSSTGASTTQPAAVVQASDGGAVSYTHLDVYKRQALHRGHLRNLLRGI